VNRHVAKCRAEGNTDEMNRSVSSVLAVQYVISAIVLAMTAVALFAVPRLFAARLGAESVNASWVIGFLGASLAVQMACDTSRGVLSGVHRWDVYNAVNAGGYLVTVSCMIVALVNGGGLRSLAVVHFVTTVGTEYARTVLARRYCPELRTSLSLATWSHARAMIVFGGKSVIAGISPLVVIQGCSILVAGHLGPAALAVFSRPGGLMRNGQAFVNKFAYVLTPTAGSLQGAGQEEEIRELLVRTTRMAACMAIPLILFLAILGDPLLRLWMGDRYEAGAVMAIIAVGYLLPTTQVPVLSILVGMNLHGRSGVVVTAVTVATFAACAATLNRVGWSLEGAALATALPLTLGNGVVVMAYACRLLHIRLPGYISSAFLLPMLWNLPFAAALVASRVFLAGRPLAAVLAGAASTLLLLPVYWFRVLPGRIRTDLSERYLPPALRGRA
jgi:O-antigen/teichoic acid export membrane protein